MPAGLARILDEVGKRVLVVKVAEFPVLLLAFISIAWLLQGTADRLLDLGWGVRVVLLVLDLLAAAALLWIFAIVPWRQRLDRKKAALLVERTLPAFRSSLISAVELSDRSAEYPAGSQPLVEKLLADAAAAAEKEDVVRKVVRMDRLKRRAKWAAGAFVLALLCFILAHDVSPVLVRRILLSNAPLPSDTRVVAVTKDFEAIAGTDAAVSARAEGVIPSGGRLIVTRANGTSESIPVPASRTDAGVFPYAVRNVREPFRYRFELNDGVGSEYKVGVLVPPSLQDLTFVQDYPNYTNLPDAAMLPSNLRLLAGSKLRIKANASEALKSAVIEIKGEEQTIPMKISGDRKTEVSAEIEVPERGWKSMSMHLAAASGGVSANDPVYRIELMTDRLPSITVAQPKKQSQTVIAGAKVPFVFKVSDDFGLAWVSFNYRVFRPSLDGTMESAEEGQFPVQFDPVEKSFSRTLDWDLSRLVPPVPVGCSISC